MTHVIEPNTIYHVGISGGKDSTALLLWAVYETGIPHSQLDVTFCDTQNEAECTYEHITLLSERVFPIRWLETEGFYQLAKRKKRFPSAKARFCTIELKLKVSAAHINSLLQFDETDPENPKLVRDVIALSGVRRGESFERRDLPEWGQPEDSYFGIREWRPLIDWSLKDVLAIHSKYDIPLNPLYAKGAKRVGCFPCVMSNKAEIRAMAKHFPERIDRIRQHEQETGSSFFAPTTVPPRFRTSGEYRNKHGELVQICKIDDVVRWAKTGKGAVGLPADEDLFAEQSKDIPPTICLAQSLTCE